MNKSDLLFQDSIRTFFTNFLKIQALCIPLFSLWHLFAGNYLFFSSLVLFFIVNIVMIRVFNEQNQFRMYRLSSSLISIMLLLLVCTFPEVHIYYVFFLILPLIFFLFLGRLEGKIWCIAFSIPLSLIYIFIHLPASHEVLSLETLILYLSIISIYFAISYFAYMIEEILITSFEKEKAYRKELEVKQTVIQHAMDEIKTLKETLPVCSHCKKIRDENGKYYPIEEYLLIHTDTKVTHSLCPDCVQELYPEYAENILKAAHHKGS